MSERFDLVISGTGYPGQRRQLVSAVGTLPRYYQVVPRADHHLAWVLAACPDWPDLVAEALGANPLAVVVDEPMDPSPAAIDRLADAGIPLILNTPQLFSPALAQFAAAVGPLTLDWVEVLALTAGDMSPQTALFNALAMLQAAGMPVKTLDSVVVGAQAVLADARLDTAHAHLSCVRGPHRQKATIKAFGPFGSLETLVGDPRAAFPGEVVKVDATGATVWPHSYQTPRRLALLEAHATMAESRNPLHSLSAYARPAALSAADRHWGGESVFLRKEHSS
ncbi:MAG: hypothetical protein LBI99_04825 [Propionibacteriaceae bacterium]|jgi:hypothetical protein|nr:hypothetical protein [Propionibacteriaceae bacterium]